MKRIIRLTALMLAMVMLMSSCSVVHFFRTGSFVDNAAIQPEQFEKYTGAPLTSITITNESNNGYTFDDFEAIVQQHGFTVTERTERYVKAEMGRFVISLMAGKLTIGARTTNKYGIIY